MMINSFANVEKAEEWGPRSSPMWTLPMISPICPLRMIQHLYLRTRLTSSCPGSVGIHKKGKIRVTTLNMEDRSSDLQSRSGEAIGR